MEELRCAATVSLLEGMRNIGYCIENPAKSTTLPALESRIRRLEANMNITSPPPVTENSWKGVVWRIWRLRSKMPRFNVKEFDTDFSHGGTDFETMIPDGSNITLDDLKNTIISIKSYTPYPPWPELESDDVKLSFSLQVLCHMAGRKNNYFDTLPVTLVDIYVVAVRLSLLTENCAIGVVPMPPPGRARPIPFPQAPKKACCGCCSCTCHHTKKPTVVVPPLRAGRRRYSRSSSIDSSIIDSGKRKLRFGWLNKLCFWRKKPAKDDASFTSSGSSTIV